MIGRTIWTVTILTGIKVPNIFEQFAYAFVPPKYGSPVKVKVGSMIGFVVLLTLLATILSAVKFFIDFSRIGNSLDFMVFLLCNAVFSGCVGGGCDHAEENACGSAV